MPSTRARTISRKLARSVPGRGGRRGRPRRPGEFDPFVERTDGQQPSVAGELAWRWRQDEWRAKAVQDLRPDGWYTHRPSPRLQNDLSAHSVKRATTCAIPQPTEGTREVTYRWVLRALEY